MRYITEMDLRDLYHEEPFTTYYLATDNRLTPGARQFLTDRRIPCETAWGERQERKADAVPAAEETEPAPSWQLMKLWHTLEHAESLIMVTAEWFSRHGEHLAAEDFTALARTLQRTRLACEQGEIPPALTFWNCTEGELREKVDDTVIPFSPEKLPEDEVLRAKLLMLNHLRTYLQMLEPLVLETQSRHGDAGPGVYEGLIHILHSLTNVLCIMMGKYMRGSV